MSQTLDPIDDAHGRSIGCILERDGVIIAITPSGASRECGDRVAAIAWLHECSGLSQPPHVSRQPDIVEWALLIFTGICLLFYFYLLVR
jgi:hypothetical protein